MPLSPLEYLRHILDETEYLKEQGMAVKSIPRSVCGGHGKAGEVNA